MTHHEGLGDAPIGCYEDVFNAALLEEMDALDTCLRSGERRSGWALEGNPLLVRRATPDHLGHHRSSGEAQRLARSTNSVGTLSSAWAARRIRSGEKLALCAAESHDLKSLLLPELSCATRNSCQDVACGTNAWTGKYSITSSSDSPNGVRR
jgi:hypothetical protein